MIPARLRSSPTFASLGIRNYRVYFTGQVVSLAGTWMQTVAQGLLVVKLTDRGWVLGLVVATQMMPVLLFGLWAGVVADRMPKRTLLVTTQVLAAACAATLGVLVATDTVRLWMVFVMAGLLGVVQAFENPTRQSFVPELVPPYRLANAIGLNSVMVNLARIVGPSMAGILSATVGLAACFFLNAASYVAVIVALLVIRADELRQAPRSTEPGQLRQGLSYVRHTPVLFVSLVLLGVVGTLAYEFPVTLPLFAKHSFGNEDLYGLMSALQGVGAVVGALWVASRFQLRSPAVLSGVSMALGVFIVAVAVSPTLPIALALIVAMGAVSIGLISIGNTILQLEADPAMRGRVMALWSIALIGSTTIGGPFVGWVSDVLGARSGLALGGIAALAAGAATYPALRRLGPRRSDIDEPPRPAPRVADPLPQERPVGGILPSPPS